MSSAAVLRLLGGGDEEVEQACQGLEGMAQNEFLERLLELDRSNQAFQCLSVLAGPRDTLQPHQLKMHTEAKRGLFWHLDRLCQAQPASAVGSPEGSPDPESLEEVLKELAGLLVPCDTSRKAHHHAEATHSGPPTSHLSGGISHPPHVHCRPF